MRLDIIISEQEIFYLHQTENNILQFLFKKSVRRKQSPEIRENKKCLSFVFDSKTACVIQFIIVEEEIRTKHITRKWNSKVLARRLVTFLSAL